MIIEYIFIEKKQNSIITKLINFKYQPYRRPIFIVIYNITKDESAIAYI